MMIAKRGALILLSVLSCASGSAVAQSKPADSQSPEAPNSAPFYPFSRPIRELVAGDWSAGSCSESFQRFLFSEDGTKMFAVPNIGFLTDFPGGQLREISTYNVLLEYGRILRMEIEDEERRTADGRVVVWDLVLLSEDSFCWHRTDWRQGGCTQPRTRCPG
jgi:hypothetical protein